MRFLVGIAKLMGNLYSSLPNLDGLVETTQSIEYHAELLAQRGLLLRIFDQI